MTLHTKVAIQHTGPAPARLTGREGFDLALRAILRAAERDESEVADVKLYDPKPGTSWDATAKSFLPDGTTDLMSVLGQGLPGIIDATYNDDGSPLYLEDAYSDEEEDEDPYFKSPAALMLVGWDTAYGYDQNGIGCTELHARALVHLLGMVQAKGFTLSWKNEYTGEWHAGVRYQDIAEFVGNGGDAMNWFLGVVKPAVTAEVAAEGGQITW